MSGCRGFLERGRYLQIILEVGALRKALEFLQSGVDEPCLHGAYWRIVMLEQERFSHNSVQLRASYFVRKTTCRCAGQGAHSFGHIVWVVWTGLKVKSPFLGKGGEAINSSSSH